MPFLDELVATDIFLSAMASGYKRLLLLLLNKEMERLLKTVLVIMPCHLQDV